MNCRRLFTNFKWGVTGESQLLIAEDDRVVYRGPELPELGESERIDLGGRFLLPGLTESHCHILPTGLDMAKLHLGHCDTVEAVLDAVRDRHRDRPDGWLLAVHYDQNRWGGEHITRRELDAISTSRPIHLRHVNGHASVSNSACLAAAGIAEAEPDPEGGSFGRFDDGACNGVGFEGGHERISAAIPKPSLQESVDAILAAGASMAAWGITTAVDMQTEAAHLEAYRLAAERGCPIRLRLYMIWKDVFGPKADPSLIESFRGTGGTRPVVAGVKLFADGAIGSGTAAIHGSYIGKEAGADGTSGQLIYSPARLTERVVKAHDAGYQIAIHAIGDYALDVVCDAYEATGDAARHRIEHAMLADDSQLDRVARLGLSISMQPEFLIRFGHAYRAQLGENRSLGLLRFRSVLDRGIPLAFSSDRPICKGNPWDGMQTACRRPAGFGEKENLTRAEAIERYLSPSAHICGENGLGGLNPGQELDGIVMESDPLLPGTPKLLANLQAF